MTGKTFTLADIERIGLGDPTLARYVERLSARNYLSFVEVLTLDLDDIIAGIEENAEHHFSRSEVETSYFIASHLSRCGYAASCETSASGAVDILVRAREPRWSWLGEAKIFRSVSDLREGWLQLTTRYRNSDPNCAHGALIAYCDRPRASEHLASWFDEFMSLPHAPAPRVWSPLDRKRLTFQSVTVSQATGLELTIRHCIVARNHAPIDKSARNVKKRAGKRTDGPIRA